MFRKRQKKQFPPGTFIPTAARICAIIQLCLAFSVLLWNTSEPFVGEIFTLKSRLLFYQDVMGISVNDTISAEKSTRLERNKERFKALPKNTQNTLSENMQSIQKQLQRSLWDKIKSVVTLFTYKLSPYELAWIFFSVVLSILLLKRVEGASQAIWILPLLTACYAFDTRWFTHAHQNNAEAKLFPSEHELIENYIKEPLSENIFEQQDQLTEGWKRYLIINWAHQAPLMDKSEFERQAEDGEFNFTLARLELRAKQKNFLTATSESPPPSLLLLLFYFFWNAYFAYTAWKLTRRPKYG